MMSKQVTKFLNYKIAKQVLKDKTITEYHIVRLDKLFDEIPVSNLYDWVETISKFILYDLNNYKGRINRLKKILNGSDYSYFLRYGRSYVAIKQDHSIRKTKHFKNKNSYWTSLGFSEAEAVEKVKEIQQNNAAKAVVLLRGTNIYSSRSLVFWMRKGYSEEDARNEVKRVNSTNGIAYYVKKYGEEEGKRLYDIRLKKWLATLDAKTADDKVMINKKKGPSIEGNMARGLSLEDATARYQDHCMKMKNKKNQSFSKISQDLFNRLEQHLLGTCYYQFKNYEYNISGFRVDFYHKESGTVIEFYGDFFHRNPILFEEDYECFGKTSNDVWQYDEMRTNIINQHSLVSSLIIVWESEYRKNPVETVKNLLSKIGEKYVC